MNILPLFAPLYLLRWNSVYVAGKMAAGHVIVVAVVPVKASSLLMVSKFCTVTVPVIEAEVTWLLDPDRSFQLVPSQLLAL